jgi:hypothetical protein
MLGRFAPLLSDEVRTFMTFHGAVLLPEPNEPARGSFRLLDLSRRLAWSARNPGIEARSVARRLRRLWLRPA